MARLQILAICVLAGCHFSAGAAHDDDAAAGMEPAPPGGGGYHKVIRIVGAGTTTLASFPLWIDLVDPDLAAHATSAGSDIYFALPGGSKLDFELERWDPHTGTLMAWVGVPALAAGTAIELHYGDPASPTPPNSAAVFSGFAAVWHMSDPPTSTTVVDATGQHNGTAQSLGAGAHIPGKLAGGIAFSGSNQVNFTNPLQGPSSHTISAWVLQQASGNGPFDSVLTVGSTQTGQARFLDSRYGATPGVAVGFFGDDWTNTNATVTKNTWTLLHWVFDGPNRRSRLYQNGVLAGEFAHNNSINTSGTTGILGNAPAGFGNNVGFPGVLDEVRIATAMLTPDWIMAEFANQSDPAKFYSVAAEQAP